MFRRPFITLWELLRARRLSLLYSPLMIYQRFPPKKPTRGSLPSALSDATPDAPSPKNWPH